MVSVATQNLLYGSVHFQKDSWDHMDGFVIQVKTCLVLFTSVCLAGDFIF